LEPRELGPQALELFCGGFGARRLTVTVCFGLLGALSGIVERLGRLRVLLPGQRHG